MTLWIDGNFLMCRLPNGRISVVCCVIFIDGDIL